MKQSTLNAIACVLLTLACLWGCLPHAMPAPPQDVVGAPRSSCWPATRAAYLKAHPKCEACGGREGLQVHHCIPFNTTDGKALECEPSNLITFCTGDTLNCHLWIGHAGNFQTYNPNVREDAKRFREMIANRTPNK